jgi:hypothetical protein
MSLNNNQDDNNQLFGEEFSEEQQNFDNDPAVVAATESISSKGKGRWLILLAGMMGTFGYLAYRYYLAPQGTTPPKTEIALSANNNTATPGIPPVAKQVETRALETTNAGQVSKSNDAKHLNQENKNAQFEQLRASLFENNGQVTKTAVVVPPPSAESTTPKNAIKTATASPVVSVPAPKPPDNVTSVNNAVQQVTQLNERLEINIHQIQHLEEVLQGITQTIAKLNTDISAMDNRLLALSNSTGNLSTDVGTIKNEMSTVKRVLGEEGVLDIHVPPPPSHHGYLKASQLASARPKSSTPAYLVHAIIPGRAWLKANNGQIMTVTEGDTLGDYGKVLVIDAASGMVLTSSGNTFQ